jgi:hypothetical protein
MRRKDRSTSDEEDGDRDCAGKVDEDSARRDESVKCDTRAQIEKSEEEVEDEDKKDGRNRDV